MKLPLLVNPYVAPFGKDRRQLKYDKKVNSLRSAITGEEATEVTKQLHLEMRQKIDELYPCVFAKSVMVKTSYLMSFYQEIADPDESVAIADDLIQFINYQNAHPQHFSSFIAVFPDLDIRCEHEFEAKIWAQLGILANLDRSFHPWDSQYSSNPADSSFSFSFGGRGYFIVGLHAGSSRMSRRFPFPSIVFNAQSQFDKLKRLGVMDEYRTIIRGRDVALQGNINPNLAELGDSVSEARLYSGRVIEKEWICPFGI